MGQEWTMLQPDKQAQVPVPLTPPAKAKQVIPSRTGKRKSVDQMAGNARQQAQHNTYAHNAQAAREILHAQAQAQAKLQELQAEARVLAQSQARALAQAQTPQAPQPLPVVQCATPDDDVMCIRHSVTKKRGAEGDCGPA